MSVVFVVVPVVAGGWPVIAAAVTAAGAALGYRALRDVEAQERALRAGEGGASGIEMVMADSQVVQDTLMRGESFTLQNGALTATFRVDGRGACTVHVSGPAHTPQAELEAAGRTLMDRVRQQFAYAKVMTELEQRGFHVAAEHVDADRSIRIRVRRTP